MKRLIFFLSIFLCNFSYGQPGAENYSLKWFEGELVFRGGDTVECTLRYIHTATTSLLQVKHGPEIVTVTAADVRSFRFYDYEKLRWRRYVSLVMDSTSNRPIFLQALYADKERVILTHRTVDVRFEYMRYIGPFSKPSRLSKKYIWDVASGQVMPLSKENALSLVADKKPAVEAYIKNHHLRFRKTLDYISLFKFHDTL